MSTAQFDVVVIGAGAGGLFTAARLAHRGYRTLVVERLDKVGGRASTVDIEGFKVNNGAIVIEVGGITQQTCEEVGAEFDIREPNPPLLYRIGGKDVDVTGGGWGLLLGRLTRQGAKLVKGIGAARSDSGLPEDEISTADWVSRYTKNEGVHGIFRNMCASIFAVGSEDLPARVFLTYFTRKSAFKRFGFHPEGTIGLWRGLVTAIESHGGQLWLSTPVCQDRLRRRQVSGLQVIRDGQSFDRERTGRRQRRRPCRHRQAARRRECPDRLPGCGEERRPAHRDDLGQLRQPGAAGQRAGDVELRQIPTVGLHRQLHRHLPEMAPPGWNLYVGTAVPKPSIGDFDDDAETALLLDDLRDTIDRFDERARILNIAVTRDDWPPQRAVAGFDLPSDTPFDGLWNVGDAVKEYANGGTTACAETAQLVVDKIVAAHRPAAVVR